MRNTTRIAAWFVGMAVGGAVQPASSQSLIDELQDLAANHPAITARQKAKSAAGEGTRAALSAYYPTVRLQSDAGPEYVDSPDRRTVEGKAFYRGGESSGVIVTQRLFDGDLRDASVGAARMTEQMAEADLRNARQSMSLEGTMAYIDVLRQTRLIALSRENERKVQEQLNLEDERVQKGAGISSDVLAAKQRLQVAKERRVDYEGRFQTAIARYTQVFGHAPEVSRLSDPPVPADLIPPQLEEALKSAEQDNPRLAKDTKAVAVASERRRAAESGYYPNIDLVGRAEYQNDRNAEVGVRREWALLLTATWEIFSGFKTDAQVAQASYELGATRDLQRDTGRKVSEAVRAAWFQLRTARERLGLLDNAAVLAEEVWQAQRKRREAGKATVQDVLDEETRINDARIKYTEAYYDMIRYSYELVAAMGRLEVENIVRPLPDQAAAVRNTQPVE